MDVVGANLAAFRDRTNYEPARSLRPGLVGVNVGKNKASLRSLDAVTHAQQLCFMKPMMSAGIDKPHLGQRCY